jgi:Fe-S cluster biogenesis protein NfuA
MKNSEDDRMVESNGIQYTDEEKMKALIDRLNAYIEQYHGGSVEIVTFENRVLKVRLGGACLGCPLSPSTLQGWVAGTVHQFFPDVIVKEADS